jgi:hypothetical protein
MLNGLSNLHYGSYHPHFHKPLACALKNKNKKYEHKESIYTCIDSGQLP